MFGKEKYNPELSKELGKKMQDLKEEREELMERVIHISMLEAVDRGRRAIDRRMETTGSQLAEQTELAQGEATKLNAEYSKRLEAAQRVLDELFNFEKEKLGMHQEPAQPSTDHEMTEREKKRKKDLRMLASEKMAYEIRLGEEKDPKQAEYYKDIVERLERGLDELRSTPQTQ